MCACMYVYMCELSIRVIFLSDFCSFPPQFFQKFFVKDIKSASEIYVTNIFS